MEVYSHTQIGVIVAGDYRTASVFKQFGIDFCCQGNRTIEQACTQQHIDSREVIDALRQLNGTKSDSTIDYDSWPIDLLADYIEKKHHRYVTKATAELLPYLEKIVKVHGGHHPELLEIEQLFKESAGELAMHMKKEELVLFPFIRKMVLSQSSGRELPGPSGLVQNAIAQMLHEHNHEGDRFRQIANLTQQYTPPADACNTYKVTYALLQAFEEDLHLHIHLENNILFPKAADLEKSFTVFSN